ncbi:MAG: hypothetical protein JWQ04_2834 [Pedosphaera sp.]|nr:hypothetical protein [Pedosphaera sp.]
MTLVKKPVSRRIVVGEVERRYIRILNSGHPNGLRMHWRGRVDWCQPFEFVRWSELAAAVRIRLGIAGLKTLVIECAVPENTWDGPRQIFARVTRL